jgi:carboxyl-terminal processing protease
MLPASNKGVGMNLGFPDVCNTPVGPATVPIPYPNLALNAQAAPFSPVVKVSMVPALNMGSKIPMTSGDEAGVAHPMIKQVGAYTMGNPIVYVDKLPAVNLTCPTTGNGMNNGLGAVLVPSITNVFYTLAPVHEGPQSDVAAGGARWDADVTQGELEAMSAPLAEGLSAHALDEQGLLTFRIRAFTAHLPGQVHSHLAHSSVRAVLFDLRGCPGGDALAALALAEDFLPMGAPIAQRVERDATVRGTGADHEAVAERDITVLRSRASRPHGQPVTILVDGNTASAAELFTASLASHGRALVVGTRTRGKGAAQVVARSLDGRQRLHTAAWFEGPRGEPIEGAGVEPHVAAGEAEAQVLAMRGVSPDP